MVHELRHISDSLPSTGQLMKNAEKGLPISPKCLTCLDIGWVYPLRGDGKTDYSHVVPCRCQAERIAEARRLRLLEFCELPKESENLTLETFRPGSYPTLKRALEYATALANGADKIKWLTLSGDRDLGKTHLAIAVCRHWLERGQPAKYIYVPLMLDWLKESFDRDKRGEPDLSLSARMKILMEISLLVLDDLGVQVPTPWAMERLMTIIDYRYINKLPLMVTTNKSVGDLPGDGEGRIGSRLKRFIPGKVLVLEAPDYITRRNK